MIATLLVGGLHLHYSGVFDAAAGPEDPQLQALAIHLADSGVKFYGAYWCPRCQEQKAVFEASAKRLPYVECSSGGQGQCAHQSLRGREGPQLSNLDNWRPTPYRSSNPSFPSCRHRLRLEGVGPGGKVC